MKKTVLVVEPPSDSVMSKYLLAVTRPGNIGAGPSLIFIAADALRPCPSDFHALEALRGEETVALFPATLPYLMIERKATRFVTQAAIARYEKSVADQVRKIYKGQLVSVGDATAILLGSDHPAKEPKEEEDIRPLPGQYI